MSLKGSQNFQPSNRAVTAFWRWFSSESDRLAELLECSKTREIVKMIAPRVRLLGSEIGWEIGPGDRKENALSFSLNGSLENLPAAKGIVEAAPDLPKWEFNAGRPPKDWDGRFQLRNEDGQSVSVDASSWRYILTAFDKGSFFDLRILAELPPMDEKAKAHAARLTVQSLLGERAFLERIDRIEFVNSLGKQELERLTPMLYLKSHIERLDEKKDSKHHR